MTTRYVEPLVSQSENNPSCILMQEQQTCLKKQRRESDQKQVIDVAENSSDARIVNGYDVDKDCMKRPWLVFIRFVPFSKSLFHTVFTVFRPVEL